MTSSFISLSTYPPIDTNVCIFCNPSNPSKPNIHCIYSQADSDQYLRNEALCKRCSRNFFHSIKQALASVACLLIYSSIFKNNYLRYFCISLAIDTQKLYDEAMKNGYVDRKIIKCLIIGAAGVGKTTIKHLLLGKEPPEKRVSTGVMENPVRAVSISKAGYHNGSWCKVESDEELMIMIAEAIKSEKVPMDNETMAEQNDDGMLYVPADAEHIPSTDTAESIHMEFIDAINNSKGTVPECHFYKGRVKQIAARKLVRVP